MMPSLSELQKDILDAAYHNHQKRLLDPEDKTLADLFDHEALHLVFDLPYREKRLLRRVPDPRSQPGAHFFAMKTIGEKRYATVREATLRAFAELERLQLCTRQAHAKPEWYGIDLTKTGVAAVKASLAHGSSLLPDI